MTTDGMTVLLTKAGEFLDKAVRAREDFYQGIREAAAKALRERQPNLGPEDAKYRFGESATAKQLIADNKWHMTQSRTWSILAMAKGIHVLVYEHKRTNALLEENNALLKEVRNALRSR